MLSGAPCHLGKVQLYVICHEIDSYDCVESQFKLINGIVGQFFQILLIKNNLKTWKNKTKMICKAIAK